MDPFLSTDHCYCFNKFISFLKEKKKFLRTLSLTLPLNQREGIIIEREGLNLGTVPTFKVPNVGTVPTFKVHNVGTVPTFKVHNVGTVPTFYVGTVPTFYVL